MSRSLLPIEKNKEKYIEEISLSPCAGVALSSLTPLNLPHGEWNDPANANPCSWFYSEGVLFSLRYMRGPESDYRFLDLLPDKWNGEITIYIIGGPRGTIVRGEFENERRNYPFNIAHSFSRRVIIPEYLGTLYRSRYPKSDLESAANEIKELIKKLLPYVPLNKITLVAHSAGGLLAIQVAKVMPVRALLISPPLASLREISERPNLYGFKESALDHMRRFETQVTTGAGSEINNAVAPDLTQVRAFAGEAFGKDLMKQIADMPIHSRALISIAIGEEDKLYRPEDVEKLCKSIQRKQISIWKGLGRSPDTMSQAVNVLRQFYAN